MPTGKGEFLLDFLALGVVWYYLVFTTYLSFLKYINICALKKT